MSWHIVSASIGRSGNTCISVPLDINLFYNLVGWLDGSKSSDVPLKPMTDLYYLVCGIEFNNKFLKCGDGLLHVCVLQYIYIFIYILLHIYIYPMKGRLLLKDTFAGMQKYP